MTSDDRTRLWILHHRLARETMHVRMSIALDPFRPLDVIVAEVRRAHREVPS